MIFVKAVFVKALFVLNPYPLLQPHYFFFDLSSNVGRFKANCISSYKGRFPKQSYSNPLFFLCVICHLPSTYQFVEPVSRFHVS